MRRWTLSIAILVLGLSIIPVTPAAAQTSKISDAECQRLRDRLAEHARLSEGVRRAFPGVQPTAAAPAPSTAAPSAATPASRADAIRSRLAQIPNERQSLDEQRLGAMVKFDLARAGQIQGRIQALDAEKANLERELAALPTSAAPTAPTTPAPAPAPATTAQLRCDEMPAAVEKAMKIRRPELGSREEQAGAIPLVGMKGQSAQQIGAELASQFAPGPAASAQVGLLDIEGDARLDGFVDVPAAGTFRLVRQKADGTISMETFAAPDSAATPAYGEAARRVDEVTARATEMTLADLLAARPAGPVRAVAQTKEFPAAYAQFQAGNFADAARLGAAAARSTEFQNARGQNVRVLEIIAPVSGGVSMRRAVVIAQANDQELWDETMTTVRATPSWGTEVETVRSKETRGTSGAVVGTPWTSGPKKQTLER